MSGMMAKADDTGSRFPGDAGMAEFMNLRDEALAGFLTHGLISLGGSRLSPIGIHWTTVCRSFVCPGLAWLACSPETGSTRASKMPGRVTCRFLDFARRTLA